MEAYQPKSARQTKGETDREKKRQMSKERQSKTERDGERKQTDGNRGTDKWKERETDRWRGTQEEQQKQMERQTDRWIDRGTETDSCECVSVTAEILVCSPFSVLCNLTQCIMGNLRVLKVLGSLLSNSS